MDARLKPSGYRGCACVHCSGQRLQNAPSRRRVVRKATADTVFEGTEGSYQSLVDVGRNVDDSMSSSSELDAPHVRTILASIAENTPPQSQSTNGVSPHQDMVRRPGRRNHGGMTQPEDTLPPSASSYLMAHSVPSEGSGRSHSTDSFGGRAQVDTVMESEGEASRAGGGGGGRGVHAAGATTTATATASAPGAVKVMHDRSDSYRVMDGSDHAHGRDHNNNSSRHGHQSSPRLPSPYTASEAGAVAATPEPSRRQRNKKGMPKRGRSRPSRNNAPRDSAPDSIQNKFLEMQPSMMMRPRVATVTKQGMQMLFRNNSVRVVTQELKNNFMELNEEYYAVLSALEGHLQSQCVVLTTA